MTAADIYIFLKEEGDIEKEHFIDYVILKYCGVLPQYSIFLDIEEMKTALNGAGAYDELEEFCDIISYQLTIPTLMRKLP